MRAVLDSASPTHLMGDLSRFRNVRGLTSTGGARQAVVLRDVAYSPSHGINIVTIGLLRKHSGVEVDFASMMLRDERGGAVTALTEEDCVFWMDFWPAAEVSRATSHFAAVPRRLGVRGSPLVRSWRSDSGDRCIPLLGPRLRDGCVLGLVEPRHGVFAALQFGSSTVPCL